VSKQTELASTTAAQGRITRVKSFLDQAAAAFATAESSASQRRLAAVEPLCQPLFAAIIHDPVQPALVKPAGGEGLALSLTRFWNLQDVSAQALLAESFRNAFAVSVYLAAAQLYGAMRTSCYWMT
jgi:predicted RNA polymerase sigma factor